MIGPGRRSDSRVVFRMCEAHLEGAMEEEQGGSEEKVEGGKEEALREEEEE